MNNINEFERLLAEYTTAVARGDMLARGELKYDILSWVREHCRTEPCPPNVPVRRGGTLSPQVACSAPPHPDVMKAAQALIGVAWRKEQDRIPGAVDRVLDELKKHPQNAANQARSEAEVACNDCSTFLSGAVADRRKPDGSVPAEADCGARPAD